MSDEREQYITNFLESKQQDKTTDPYTNFKFLQKFLNEIPLEAIKMTTLIEYLMSGTDAITKSEQTALDKLREHLNSVPKNEGFTNENMLRAIETVKKEHQFPGRYSSTMTYENWKKENPSLASLEPGEIHPALKEKGGKRRRKSKKSKKSRKLRKSKKVRKSKRRRR